MFVVLVKTVRKKPRVFGPFPTEKAAEDYAWKTFDEEDNDTVWWIKKLCERKKKRRKPDLLKAAEKVLTNWSSGDLAAAAVRELDAAVKKAKGKVTQDPVPRGWDKV